MSRMEKKLVISASESDGKDDSATSRLCDALAPGTKQVLAESCESTSHQQGNVAELIFLVDTGTTRWGVPPGDL
jgi:hypothetical protein